MKSNTIFETILFLSAKLVSFSTPYKHLYAKMIPFLTYINASVWKFYWTLAFDKLGLQIDTISFSFYTPPFVTSWFSYR